MVARLSLAVLGVVIATGCGSERPGSPVPPAEAARILVNRNWLDRLPAGNHKRFLVYRFIPEFNHSGVYQDRTMFAGDFELFLFKHTGDSISFDLLHTKSKVTTAYTIERIQPDDKLPFDLRLKLKRSPRGGSRVYYGWSNERATDLSPGIGRLGLAR